MRVPTLKGWAFVTELPPCRSYLQATPALQEIEAQSVALLTIKLLA